MAQCWGREGQWVAQLLGWLESARWPGTGVCGSITVAPELRPKSCSVLFTYLQPILSFHRDRWDGDVLAGMQFLSNPYQHF